MVIKVLENDVINRTIVLCVKQWKDCIHDGGIVVSITTPATKTRPDIVRYKFG